MASLQGRFKGLTVALAALVALGACSENAEAPANTGGSGVTGDAAADCEGRGEQFSAGMTKQSDDGSVEVELVKSDVAPPAQLNNTWTLEPKDAQGQPLVGANVQASSMMPVHQHPPRTVVGEEVEPGVYEVVNYYSMPGLWETTVSVAPVGGSPASVVFSFCIPQD